MKRSSLLLGLGLFFITSVSPIRAFVNGYFDNDNLSWTLSAVPPAGWVEVPGNSLYSTTNFMVMKYEAKIQGEADGNKSYSSAYVAQSRPDGTPWVNISALNAADECEALGAGYHLLSNSEWMTIARNIESQNINWSLGTVGLGYLFAGYNNDPTPVAGESVPASINDTGNYRCAFTDGNRAQESPVSCPANTAAGTSASSGTQVRTHVLSNGDVIWDFAGNINEQIIDIIDEPDQPVDNTAAFNWQEYPSIIDWGSLGRDAYAPLDSTFTTNQGVGAIYSGRQIHCGPTYCSIHRGGTFFDGINVGVFMAGLDWGPTGQSFGAGFRCAVDLTVTQSFLEDAGRSGGANLITASSSSDVTLTQTEGTLENIQYTISAYLKDQTSGNEGGVIDLSVAQLYYNDSGIVTTYHSADNGWWRLSATFTGTGNNQTIGILIKANHVVAVDQFELSSNQRSQYHHYPPDPNDHFGWVRRIDAGPHYVGNVGFIHGQGNAFDALAMITRDAHHDDLSIVIVSKDPQAMVADKLVTPFPWMQGFNTAGYFYQFSAYSAFNGYPVTNFDNPVTIVIPYDPVRVTNIGENRLRIAYYDFKTNRWKLLNRNTVLDKSNHTLANTIRQFSYFTVVYPVDTQ